MGPSAVPIPPSTSIVAMFDNITVDGDGNVLIEEDPGNNPYIAKIWRVNPTTKTAVEIFHSDPVRFGTPHSSVQSGRGELRHHRSDGPRPVRALV